MWSGNTDLRIGTAGVGAGTATSAAWPTVDNERHTSPIKAAISPVATGFLLMWADTIRAVSARMVELLSNAAGPLSMDRHSPMATAARKALA